ncbi:1-acyl-sn-glycerol-3-phosphate acyltransferase [Mycolicibacter senuensis]|uniref:Membrane protein n=1 Tax=Mycolicibacter senuensis TaxID=386913 RepID=A0A7I9XFE8_9MYCO|nr:1-acyl-sn-glycerol-3-phosphate acyltransferase [Mycolicibacter senuensis]MDQ2628708.1 1-acyl-sn-glycerol-3-phosphate acyltransferase [Actinomycetota bacterium]ORW70631.1 glycerol acyltransferase [Mycolicibacter senuensis]GFG68693.1 membrane protein [Mycolicibacter senuensis]
MHVLTDTNAIMNQPLRVELMRRVLEGVADAVTPLAEAYRPYVEGLDNLPRDGRFLLVGNHTQVGAEALLIPFHVRRAIGKRVRPLTDRQFGRMRGPARDLLAAAGALVGAPEPVRELMRNNEPILVFPGGGREIPKFKGEEYTLRWQGRAGFARLAVEHGYPIVPVGLIGGDDVYRSFTRRGGSWERFSGALSQRFSGRPDMAMPLQHGIGPTLIPRPNRMYLHFGVAVDTTRPAPTAIEDWAADVRQQTRAALEQILAELLAVRADDPYRHLNPLNWRQAVTPPG